MEEPQLGEEVGPPLLVAGLELEQVVLGEQQLPALAVAQAGGEEEGVGVRSPSSHQRFPPSVSPGRSQIF